MFGWINKRVASATLKPRDGASSARAAAEQCKDRGNAFLSNGDLAAAAAYYSEAIHIDASYAEAHNNLGIVHSRAGRIDEAIACFKAALALKPNLAQAHNNLGNAHKQSGRLDEARACFNAALEAAPGNADALNNIGLLHYERGQSGEARARFEQAIASKPDFAEARSNLGMIFREAGELDAAFACFLDAVHLNPNLAEAYNNLGTIAQDQGRFDEARRYFRQALACRPDYADAMSNALLASQYDPSLSPADIHAEHLLFAEHFELPWRPSWPMHRNSRDPDRQLRIGFVSGDLRSHPVGFFLENVLAHIDRRAFQVALYPTNHRMDSVTARLRAGTVAWHPLAGLSDEAAARLIMEDGIDILIDLAGHTADNRLPLFARKPAPVQASWLYFSTTGLSSIDYVLCDRFVMPGGDEKHFVERPWRLPDSYLCFTPPAEEVDVGPLPALSAGHVTFGCFNNLSKLNDSVVDCWARVLSAVPGSQLMLKSKQLADEATRTAVRTRFGSRGVAPARLLLDGPSPRLDYLRCYQRVDVALDPFPFPGGTTTVEALWMGVPVLGRRGDRFISRAGESILHTAGLPDWIADDHIDYVVRAAAFAARIEDLARLRGSLRGQLLASPLCDAPRFARGLEAALRGMWRDFAGRGAPAATV